MRPWMWLLAVTLVACQQSAPSQLEGDKSTGGEMFAAAEIFFNNQSHPVTLEALRDHLRKTLGGQFELTEWRGYGAVIPQLLVKGDPSWTLQVEDAPEYVPGQIAERAEGAAGVLPQETLAKLRQCNATLAAMGISEQAPPQEIDGQIVVVAETTLDPSDPKVRRVLLAVAQYVDGIAYDLTEGEWIDQ